MRLRGTAAAVIVLGIVPVIASCRALEGLGGFHFDGGSGGAGSGGHAAGAEICTNGVDDNGDGLVDCADPECAAAGYACVDAVPSGWTGPLALQEGLGGAPACAGLYPEPAFQGGSDPQGAPATCAPCSCEPPAAPCSGVDLRLYNGSSCSGSNSKVTLMPGVCSPLGQGASRVKEEPATTAGACSPGGGAAQVPPIAWKSVALACGGAALGGGCANGGVCAPRAPAPFGAARCLAQEGDQSCPTGYPQKLALVTAMDQRGCSACACDAIACAVTTDLFDDMSCENKVGTLSTANTCAQASNATAAMVTATASCPASGGAPSGAVQTSPWTLCCAL